MANVAFNTGNAAVNPFNAANQGSSGAVPQSETSRFGLFSVKNWPEGFKNAIKEGGEALARKLAGTQIENRTIGQIIDHDQDGTQETCSADKYSNGNHSVRHSSENPGGSTGLLRPSHNEESHSNAMKLACLLKMIGSASAQGTTTTEAVTTTAQNLSDVITLDNAVFAQAVKESTELVAFLNVAFNDALTEAQQTTKNKVLVGGTAAGCFLGTWIGVGTLFGQLLSEQLAGSDKTDMLIKSIEGGTKLWAAYKLHQLIEMSGDLRGRLEVDGERIVVSEDPEAPSASDPEAAREVNITGDSVRGRHNTERTNAEPGRTTALEEKYKERFNRNSDSLYGNLANVVKYVATQAAREGGELGVLSGVTMAPYLIAGANIGTAVATVALSGASGASLPVFAYFGSKGMLGLISHIERKFNDTDWLARKAEGFSNAVGGWTKEMLVFALASYAVHEFEEVLNIDVKLWNLAESYPWLSEKELPFSAVSALVPYDANPTFWQALVIGYAWAKHAVLPSAKFGATQLNHIYHKIKGDSLAIEGAASSPHEQQSYEQQSYEQQFREQQFHEQQPHEQQPHDNDAFELEMPPVLPV